ncbi:hypothetical protein [Rubricoccus marinus]|uniref:Uncharacterized protein n=1 Tax=Rubricoccus marinus TaxID=716817 RepID=A0A259TZC0_9BACT|nr:hypothetical protein [Rubricoccus marinus]OZC03123.1 hypothetical protein BSZ36_09140 [Rubricoccus marinus]
MLIKALIVLSPVVVIGSSVVLFLERAKMKDPGFFELSKSRRSVAARAVFTAYAALLVAAVVLGW